jgi:DNA topoisomerase III
MPNAKAFRMGKTLVIAEKPSVGRDLAGALPGSFEKSETHLLSDDYVVTWAVGHLLELAQPEKYDEKFKKWRMADLPIVPETFQLKPRDPKSRKQLNAILKLMKRKTSTGSSTRPAPAARES